MALRTLFEAGYETFVDENRDRADLWFFIHIPKSAGSSFGAEMGEVLQPSYNVHVYDDESNRPHMEKIAVALRAFRGRLEGEPFRFASGHIPLRDLKPLTDGNDSVRLFTILRDPVDRFISDFRYQSTPEHPDHLRFRAQYPTFDSYLANEGEANKMCLYLAPAPAATVEETIEYALDRLTFVGLVEMYPFTFRVIMDLLGSTREPSLFLRRTNADAAYAVKTTPELVERIRKINAKDVALYDFFRERLLPLRGEVFEHRAKSAGS